MRPLRNVPVSVRRRLLNLARTEKRPFNELLQYYAMERFLYRLSQSAHAERFILKGALMLRVWRSPEIRPTMDIDMLCRTSNDEAVILAQIRDIITANVEPDGLIFDPDSIRFERIIEDTDYEGMRVRLLGALDTARVHMQIDIGFGDIVYPGPVESDLPTLLDFPVPRLFCYSRESAIAEKLAVMMKLGVLNSRMKDFYDIWLLSRYFDFEGAKLSEAIRLTLKQRGTVISADIGAFDDSFVELKQVQWAAFRKRLRDDYIPPSFGDIVSTLKKFLEPVISALSQGDTMTMDWKVPGLWIDVR